MAGHLREVEARMVKDLLRRALQGGFHARALIISNDEDRGLLGTLVPASSMPDLSEVERAELLEASLNRACDDAHGPEAKILLGLEPYRKMALSERRARAHGSPADDAKAAETFRKNGEQPLLLKIAASLLFDIRDVFLAAEVDQLALDFQQAGELP